MRQGQKQISMYIPQEIHHEIKLVANKRKLTIKDYFLQLHRANTSPDDVQDIYEMIKQIHSMVLSGKKLSTQSIPATPRKRRNLAALDQSNEGKTSTTSNKSIQTRKNPLATLPIQVEKYLREIVNEQRRIKTTNVVLAINEIDQPTRTKIKQKLSLVGKSAPKQLDRLVSEGIVLVDKSTIPYTFSINKHY